ncbi:MAG: BNR-4 repeat-containing protein [Pirellulaceae bacterium]|nr:BNR-4 repeat-containing protein [Pirellulaceae bacterium]
MSNVTTTDRSRREFLKVVGAGATSLVMKSQAVARQRDGIAARAILVSKSGGDRGTAYVMSNKIARRQGRVVCTWIDSDRQNRWAMVDPTTAKIVHEGTVGDVRRDNHCGAAMTTDTDGTLHLLIGAHHGTFVHYRMPPDKASWQPVEDGGSIGHAATYPSLVCDREGTLHLTYRCEPGGRNARVHYCRRARNGKWSEPQTLASCAVAEHSWVTNSIEVGPSGRLHVVMSNTLPVPDVGANARYYGASHLYSDDSGETWRQFGKKGPLALPAPGAELKRIESDAMQPERIEAKYGGAAGPLNSYYHKILLSNVAVDENDQPWVVVHNLLKGSAQLFHHEDSTGWTGIPLDQAVRSVLPGFHILHCGQVSRHRDGTIEAVLMVAPESQRAWGTKGTELVRLLVGADGSVRDSELVCPIDPDMPHWLPSIERWCWHAPVDRPMLLYTRGINAGGYQHNRNQVKTEVRLQIP